MTAAAIDMVIEGAVGRAVRIRANEPVVVWIVELSRPVLAPVGAVPGHWGMRSQFAIAAAPDAAGDRLRDDDGTTHTLAVAPLSRHYGGEAGEKPVMSAIAATSLRFTLTHDADAYALTRALASAVAGGWLSVGKRYTDQWKAAVGAVTATLAHARAEVGPIE